MDKMLHAGRSIRVLNLFAYTGGATVACARAGASVCHVDAAKGMVAWGMEERRSIWPGRSAHPLDCGRLRQVRGKCEIRRGMTYDAIIMDPPSYGRGPGGEVWKLEDNL